MTGIPIPTWAAVTLFAAMALAIVGLVAHAIASQKPLPYRPLPDGFGSYYVEPMDGTEVTAERLSDALHMAAQCLSLVWPAAKVAEIASGCAVWVMAAEAQWTDSYGRTIAGQHIRRQLFVARNLSALCHELAHVVELELNSLVDMNHEGWAAKGIHAAIVQYQRWLEVKA